MKVCTVFYSSVYPRCAAFRIPEIIGIANGEQWKQRHNDIRILFSTRKSKPLHQVNADLAGSAIYAEPQQYATVNDRWQMNCVRGVCTLDGFLTSVLEGCYSDDALFRDFYAMRTGKNNIVLDVGCSDGRNMMRAQKYGGEATVAYGLEYSPESVAAARKNHLGKVYQGDASGDFVDKYSWQGKFSVVQCTALLQHLDPKQVSKTFENASRCMASGGEFLLSFKDCPTEEQMVHNYGMTTWKEDVFTADQAEAKEQYLHDGFLHTTIWDDDYYPGVTSSMSECVPIQRDFDLQGPHRREFFFYSLQWIKDLARKYGFEPHQVAIHPDSKIPFSALHWVIVFQKMYSELPFFLLRKRGKFV